MSCCMSNLKIAAGLAEQSTLHAPCSMFHVPCPVFAHVENLRAWVLDGRQGGSGKRWQFAVSTTRPARACEDDLSRPLRTAAAPGAKRWCGEARAGRANQSRQRAQAESANTAENGRAREVGAATATAAVDSIKRPALAHGQRHSCLHIHTHTRTHTPSPSCSIRHPPTAPSRRSSHPRRPRPRHTV